MANEKIKSASVPRRRKLLKVVAFSTVVFSCINLGLSYEALLRSLQSGVNRVNSLLGAPRGVCPAATSYFPNDALAEALEDSDWFHKYGGSLKSVQLFRDQSVDSTLEKLGIEFVVPKDGKTTQEDLTAYMKEYRANNKDPRGGYGQPLPGSFRPIQRIDKNKTRSRSDFSTLFENRWVEPIEDGTGRGKWDAALGPIGPKCENLITVGNVSHGGSKYICMPQDWDHNLEPGAQPCHIISVGGNDDWHFEIGARNTLGCVTHTFDCTLEGDGEPRNKPDDDDIRFYKHCIDGKSYTNPLGRSFLTYRDMLELAGIVDTPPVYFKIDVEVSRICERCSRSGIDRWFLNNVVILGL
jgi:hypothetical protein